MMQIDFDVIHDRYGTNSLKWDFARRKFGTDDVIPFWIADADFVTVPAVVEALEKRGRHGIFGYSERTEGYFASVIDWMQRRHGWTVEQDWVVSCPGVVSALSFAVQAFTKPGSKVIVQPPVYDHFYSVIESNGRRVEVNPLLLEDGKYRMDLEDLERRIDSDTKLFILCSPHNPVGRVWTRQELTALVEMLWRKGVQLVADEIHMDLVYGGNRHTPVGTLANGAMTRTMICTAPTKTFNLAGLQVSNIIIPDAGMRERFKKTMEMSGIDLVNVLGISACEAAYRDGESWLDALLEYLEGNVALVDKTLRERIPSIRLIRPEGTYLLWLDCRATGMEGEALLDFMHRKAKVGVNGGTSYAKDAGGFVRLNVACPRALLMEGLKRIERALLV